MYKGVNLSMLNYIPHHKAESIAQLNTMPWRHIEGVEV